jgi:hypothetical protein
MEVYPEWWGENTTPGTTDMTAELQAAINAHKNVKLQGTIYKLTETITLKATRLTGVEVSPYKASAHPSTGVGTWLYINHTGKGFTNSDHGFIVECLGTYRLQPTPSSSYPVAYTPTAHDYDFYLDGYYDQEIRNVCLLNPTKGIYVTGNSGRINLYNITGQPLEKGIVINEAWDVCRIDQVQFWPFWGLAVYGAVTTNENKNIVDYTQANLDTLQTLKCDGAKFSNIFSIYCKSGWRLSQNDTSNTELFQASNLYYDFAKYGIWIDSSVDNALSPTGQIHNLIVNGASVTGSRGIFSEGKGNISITGCYVQNTGLEVVYLSAADMLLRINGLTYYNYDQDASDVCAMDIANSSKLTITGPVVHGSSGGAGGRYDTTGDVFIDDWRAFTPVPASTGGTVTTFGTCTGRWKQFGNTIYVQFVIPITTNGTGSGAIGFTVPHYPAALGDWIGWGRESAGKQLQVSISDAATAIYIWEYDNTYPGADGVTLRGSIQYEIAN